MDPLYDGAPLRLVLSFLGDTDVDVADLVPPLLQQYTARLRMELSNLQVMEAAADALLPSSMGPRQPWTHGRPNEGRS